MFILQILLGVGIIWFELRRSRAKLVDITAIFNLLFLLCYVISPIAGFYMLDDWQSYSVMRYTIKGADYKTSYFYFSGIAVLISYAVFVIAYIRYKPKFKLAFLNSLFVKQINQKLIYRYALALFGLALVGILISAMSSGGLMKWVIANPRLYFTDEADSIEASSWGLDKVTQLMLFSCYIFWGLLMVKKQQVILPDRLPSIVILRFLLIISFVLSALVAVHSGGRLYFFKFFATFLIANMYIQRKSISPVKIGLLIFFGALVAIYGRLVFKYFIYKEFVTETINTIDTTTLEKFFGFINNYTYAFNSVNNNLKYGSENLMLFGDMFTWPLQFLPPSFRPDELPYTTKLNTFRLMGLKDTGIIPSDFVSYGIINGHIVGVIIVSLLFGVFMKTLNSYSYKINNPVGAILFVALAFVVGFRVMYFDPAHLFKGSFDILVGLIGVSFVSKFKTR